jgi:GT2 family glycosyltransferase
MAGPVIEVVSATRLSEKEFWQRSALGASLRRLAGSGRIRFSIAYANTRGLPGFYNARIEAGGDDEKLVFMHDDVWIDDYYFADRVVAALDAYDVMGIAGNRRRLARQPGWPFINERFEWDDRRNLSGAVAHGAKPFADVTVYGPAPAECELLDGVLLAASRETLRRHGIRFDERFEFHFYDMDFCRSVRAAGLRLGTWPICVTHQSAGAYGTPAWQSGYATYLDKWERAEAAG